MIPWLHGNTPFPPLVTALHEPNGLICAGGDLTPQRLLDAYRQGIFPWFGPEEPILWWSPDPRMVLFPNELKISRSLTKRVNRRDYRVRFDTAFCDVMHACATTSRPGQNGTWIVPKIIDGYAALHELGYAHSVEIWVDHALVGGLYGVAIGGMFYGESMFHRVTDASKLAFVYLVHHLEKLKFGMIDCQMHTSHLASLGAREIPRSEFAGKLTELVHLPYPVGKWICDDLDQ